MIATIFCDIAQELKDTGFFNPERVYEFVELINVTSDKTVPRYYKSRQDGYIDVHNWDVNGTCYLRKTASVSFTTPYTPKLYGCNNATIVQMNIPCRLVVCVPKSNLEDSPFMDDDLAAELIGELQKKWDVTASKISAQQVNLNITNYETQSSKVWEAENKGVDFSETNAYRFSYIYIDFVVSVIANVECLQNCLKDA